MARVFNFSAGPATLPEPVLRQAAEELLDWQGCGMSVMEMSHRGKEFSGIRDRAEEDLRTLLGAGDDYAVLFLQGGATLQFAMVPINLMAAGGSADYVNTGSWSQKAIKEASRYGDIRVVASSEETNFNRIPTQAELDLDHSAAYLHITDNNTIFGTEYAYVPRSGDVPLVSDMSSNILSRPLELSRYGLIYAGAQKNIGPSGLTVVIARRDLLGKMRAGAPSLFDYAAHDAAQSCLNTPPTYGIYVAGLVFRHLLDLGGLTAVAANNRRKADKLYAALDSSRFYSCPTETGSRSLMNVPFTLADSELDGAFLSAAAERGLVGLKGHRSVGGMRASLYNAMPEAGVDALTKLMAEFERLHA